MFQISDALNDLAESFMHLNSITFCEHMKGKPFTNGSIHCERCKTSITIRSEENE
jgi:hypothetical protein